MWLQISRKGGLLRKEELAFFHIKTLLRETLDMQQGRDTERVFLILLSRYKQLLSRQLLSRNVQGLSNSKDRGAELIT